MDTPSEWREMLLQYRLNELDDVRREQIDALLVSDPDFSAAMQEAEYDLLDAYAARELNETDRLRVERALRPKGRFSPEAPGRVIGSQRASEKAVAPIQEIPRAAAPRWTPLWTTAAVLVVAAVVAGSMWRSNHGAPEQAVAHPAAPAAAPAIEGSEQGSHVAPGGTTLPVPTGSAPARPEANVAMVILPGALRSQAALPLKIAAGVKTVRFLWPGSPQQAGAASYEMQVVGDDGAERCRSRGIAASGSHALQFACPAAQIPSGTSFLRVMSLPVTPDDAPLLEVTVSVERSR